MLDRKQEDDEISDRCVTEYDSALKKMSSRNLQKPESPLDFQLKRSQLKYVKNTGIYKIGSSNHFEQFCINGNYFYICWYSYEFGLFLTIPNTKRKYKISSSKVAQFSYFVEKECIFFYKKFHDKFEFTKYDFLKSEEKVLKEIKNDGKNSAVILPLDASESQISCLGFITENKTFYLQIEDKKSEPIVLDTSQTIKFVQINNHFLVNIGDQFYNFSSNLFLCNKVFSPEINALQAQISHQNSIECSRSIINSKYADQEMKVEKIREIFDGAQQREFKYKTLITEQNNRCQISYIDGNNLISLILDLRNQSQDRNEFYKEIQPKYSVFTESGLRTGEMGQIEVPIQTKENNYEELVKYLTKSQRKQIKEYTKIELKDQELIFLEFKYDQVECLKIFSFWRNKKLRQLSTILTKQKIGKIIQIIPVFKQEQLIEFDIKCTHQTLTFDLEPSLYIIGDVLSSGYKLFDNFIRIDCSFNQNYINCELNENFKKEILNKATEFILDMKRFDFQFLYHEDNSDIFQNQELLNGQSYIIANYDEFCDPGNLSGALEEVNQEGNQNSLFEYLEIQEIDDHHKRSKYDISVDMSLLSVLDHFNTHESNEICLEILIQHLSTRKRTRNHQIVIMTFLERVLDSGELPNSLELLLNDCDLEEDTPKVSWVIRGHVDYIQDPPDIQSPPHRITSFQSFLNKINTFAISIRDKIKTALASQVALWILIFLRIVVIILGFSFIMLQPFDGSIGIGTILIIQSFISFPYEFYRFWKKEQFTIADRRKYSIIQINKIMLGQIFIGIVLISKKYTRLGIYLISVVVIIMYTEYLFHYSKTFDMFQSVQDFEISLENLEQCRNEQLKQEFQNHFNCKSEPRNKKKKTLYKKIFSFGNKKVVKVQRSIVDYSWYQIHQQIRYFNENKNQDYSFTYFESAKIIHQILEHFSGDIKHQKSLRTLIDYQYNTFTLKTQIFEFIVVCFTVAAFQNRLFGFYNFQNRSMEQKFGEMASPIIQLIIEFAQVWSIGIKKMYFKASSKIFTDLVMPIGLIYYYYAYKNMQLENYDLFEKALSVGVDLQEMINDGEYETLDKFFHNKEDIKIEAPKVTQDTEIYAQFVIYSYVLSILIFIKLKNQLQMNYRLNIVIKMTEESLYDAVFFLLYYLGLLIFFCIQFMILGSVVVDLDYPTIENRYPYYIMQNFRNSLGDLQTPQYKFWEEFPGQGSTPIITIIWATWIANIVFSSMLMLNFLITVFSETYERILENSTQYNYIKRASFNVECLGMLNSFGVLSQIIFAVLTFRADEEEEEDIVQTITQEIWKAQEKTESKINQMVQRVEQTQQELVLLRQEIRSEMAEIKNLVSK